MLFAKILITLFLIKKCIGIPNDEYLTHDEYKQKQIQNRKKHYKKETSRIVGGYEVTLKGNCI